MNIWQPIETAPRDGEAVLVYSPERCADCPEGTSGVIVARWVNVSERWMVGLMDGRRPIYSQHAPTHWMPLPAAPEESQE